MQTLTRKPKQLTLAVAVLAIGAMVAVALMAGGTTAQADTTYLGPNSSARLGPEQGGPGGPTPGPAPQQTEPEDCSENPAHVVSSGHYALLEAYWDAEDKNLVNNNCPPAVTHNDDETVTREASSIDIGETVMHISGDSNLTLEANNSGDYEKWPFLYPDADDTDGNGTVEGSEIGAPYSTEIWALHDCSHDADPPPTEDDLCIGVSAGLLRSDDWDSIDFEMESVREPGIAAADRGQAFVFYKHDDVPTGEEQVLWGTHDAADTGIDIVPSEYLHPRWAFTQPGTYRFQVHVNGVLEKENSLTIADSATSVVRTYTFHVGYLSDLGVTIVASDPAPDIGEQVTYTVTASNAGPDSANDVEVTVTLPDGLNNPAFQTTDGTYDSNSGVWSVEDPDGPDDQNDPDDLDLDPGDVATLIITGTPGNGTHGEALTVITTIEAYETIGSSTVVELDPRESDNTASSTVTPVTVPNSDARWEIWRTVAENTSSGTDLGDPIWVFDADNVAELDFTLSGEGSENFDYSVVELDAGFPQDLRDRERGVQIEVAADADLDYEIDQSYQLTLGVSDGKDSAGNEDVSIDDEIRVAVMVTDVSDGVTRLVAENSAGGTLVGDVVDVDLATADSALTYRLSGTGHGKFSVESASGGAQISVADGTILNYEDHRIYYLTLHANDGTNDETVQVKINVQDDPEEQLTISLEADASTQTVGSYVTLTATVTNSPVATDSLKYFVGETNEGGSGDAVGINVHQPTRSVTWNGTPRSRQYHYRVWFTNDQNQAVQAAQSNTVVIEWTN